MILIDNNNSGLGLGFTSLTSLVRSTGRGTRKVHVSLRFRSCDKRTNSLKKRFIHFNILLWGNSLEMRMCTLVQQGGCMIGVSFKRNAFN